MAVAGCRKCGAELPSGARFCPACAAPTERGPPTGEERKVVSVLFADLVESTALTEQLDPEDVRAMLGPYFARLRAELERFGGTVEKFIGDAVMALFGAPIAHEDDPERAVRAALAIRDAIAELNEAYPDLGLHVRIAVNTGEAVVSLGARPSEGEGMASGEVITTCFRLQEAAPVDGILVGEATYRATRDVIEYREAEPVRGKGKSEPTTVWEAVAPRGHVGVDLQRPRAPLVGRWQELNLLLGALVRAHRDRVPQLVTIVGVPGIGKSRLVLELSRAVDARPELFFWLQGRSLPYGEGVTYWALAEMVKAHAGILKSDGAEAAGKKLGRAIRHALPDATEAEWAEGHLRPLIGLAAEEELRGDRRAEAFAAWRRFLEALAETRPLVLVFEDLHWADDGLLDFVDHLADWTTGAPLLVVCTARPNLFERRPGWGGGKRNAVTISLGPLSEEETALLVAALTEHAVLPDEVRAALLAQAEGNPLYTEEYVRMLIDRGVLRREDGRWQLQETGELPLPESVQAIIAARLDSLPAGEKVLLQNAAVVGKVFWAGALAAVGGASEAIEERLRSLERKELVRRARRSSVEGESEYSFGHALVREVAYAQIARARRAEKHSLAAGWIESLAAGREDHAEMRAHHYLSALEFARVAGQDTADLSERARFALREAGDRSAALNAFGRAWRFYEFALDLWSDDDPERPQLLFRFGKARFNAEEAGWEALTEARDALLAADDREAAAEAEVMVGELLWRHGERDEAFERFEEAAALLQDAPPSRSKAYVLSSLSRFRMAAGEAEEAIRVGREALRMADELGLDELRAHALNNIGVARATIGDPEGVADLARSLEIAVAINSPESVRGYLNLGTTHAALGDLRRAFELYAEGGTAAERFGDASGIGWFAVERVFEHYWSGRFDEALQLADELMAPLEEGSPHLLELGCRLVRGWICLARGDAAGAVEDADRLLGFARGAQFPQALFLALAFHARVDLASGRLEEAGALAGELLEAWAASRLTLASFWTADLAFAMSALGRGEEVIEAASGKTPTRWLEAAKALARGDARRAAELYAEIGALPEEAAARLRAAESLIATGRRSEADAELARALRFLREVRADAYIREAEALLASV